MSTVIGFEIEHTAWKDGKPFVLTADHIPGTKAEPLMVEGNGNIQLDCVSLEVVTNPTTSPEHAWEMYTKVMAEASSLIPEGVELCLIPGAEYEAEDLEASVDAMQIGCSASYDAYEGVYSTSVTPTHYSDNKRFTGLHVNIDTPEWEEEDKIQFVKTLDEVLGKFSVINWEQQYAEQITDRRTKYGCAGNYRFTPFGVEYRTLPSSSWSFESVKQIYSLVEEALKDPFKGSEDDTRDFINSVGGM